jgi:hypothetical protein
VNIILRVFFEGGRPLYPQGGAFLPYAGRQLRTPRTPGWAGRSDNLSTRRAGPFSPTRGDN